MIQTEKQVQDLSSMKSCTCSLLFLYFQWLNLIGFTVEKVFFFLALLVASSQIIQCKPCLGSIYFIQVNPKMVVYMAYKSFYFARIALSRFRCFLHLTAKNVIVDTSYLCKTISGAVHLFFLSSLPGYLGFMPVSMRLYSISITNSGIGKISR